MKITFSGNTGTLEIFQYSPILGHSGIWDLKYTFSRDYLAWGCTDLQWLLSDKKFAGKVLIMATKCKASDKLKGCTFSAKFRAEENQFRDDFYQDGGQLFSVLYCGKWKITEIVQFVTRILNLVTWRNRGLTIDMPCKSNSSRNLYNKIPKQCARSCATFGSQTIFCPMHGPILRIFAKNKMQMVSSMH